MNRKAHGESSKAAFGRDFAEVHDFLDQHAPRFPKGEHRAVYHHRDGIALVARRFGEEAARAAERHVLEDLGCIPEDPAWFGPENPDLLALLAQAWPPLPVREEVYARPGGHALAADLCLPAEGRGNGAAVLLVHGGGWSGGSRAQFRWHAGRLARRGYVAASVSYRLAQVAPFPAALLDVQAAARWLRGQAGRLGFDLGRLGAVGSSAGGHLVALLGVLEAEEGGISARANCVVDVHGIHDFLLQREAPGGVKPAWQAFLGGSLEEKRDAWLAASPARHVDARAAPMFLVHDPGDEVVPCAQSLALAEALLKAGRPVRFLPSPGSGHGFVYSPRHPWTQKAWPAAVAWLDEHLLAAPCSPP
jgi:pectinesterase